MFLKCFFFAPDILFKTIPTDKNSMKISNHDINVGKIRYTSF